MGAEGRLRSAGTFPRRLWVNPSSLITEVQKACLLPVWVCMQHKISRTRLSRFPGLIAFLAVFISGVGVKADEVALSWVDNSDNEDGFNIERATEGGEFFAIAQVAADVANYTDTQVEPGVDYRYRVNAFNIYGDSDYTNVASHYINVGPSLTVIEDVVVGENETSAAIAFTVNDLETAGGELSISFSSSNEDLVNDTGVELAGTGNEKSVTLTPLLNRSGESTITVTVSDGIDSVSRDFLFSVNPFGFPRLELSLDSIASLPRAGEEFSVQTSADDASVVASVSYWLAGELIETIHDYPYKASIAISESGSYTLTAVASIVGREETVTVRRLVEVASAPSSSELVNNLASLSVDDASETGVASYDSATDRFTLVDENGEIAGVSDSNRYFYLKTQGDVSIEARISSLESEAIGSVAGLMVRSALYGKSAQASLLLTGDSTLNVRIRSEKGAQTQDREVLGTVSDSPWLRIEKAGSDLRYYSKATISDDWTLLGSDTLDFGSEVFLGFALAAGSADGLVTANFTAAGLEGEVVPLGEDAVEPQIPSGLLISSVVE